MGEERGCSDKKGLYRVFNRRGEKFDWDNDDLSELEVVSEQPKLVDPGVAEAPLPTEPKGELGGSPTAISLVHFSPNVYLN